MNEKIFYFIPTYDGTIQSQLWPGFDDGVFYSKRNISVHRRIIAGSALCNVFNRGLLTCIGHNYHVQKEGASETVFTHFLMNHADVAVVSGKGWIDRMLEIMDEKGLDVLSANSPIKDGAAGRALKTSTALKLDSGDNRLLTIGELADMPETITPEDCKAKFGNERLMTNTGLMLVKLDRIDPVKHFFTTRDSIRATENGWHLDLFTEDWFFSTQIRVTGLKYGATRAIKIHHYGGDAWPNYIPEG